MPALDYSLMGADIVDGTGTPARRADVGLRGNRIAFAGLSPDVRAVTTLDCTGMIITPGLIDPHSHSDWSVLGNPDAFSTIHQGVTTEVVGNCGVTYAPIGEDDADTTAGALRAMGYDGPVDWRSFGELVQRVHSGPTAQNLMWFVGHTAIRSAARSATDQLRAQIRLLEEAMEAGAIGFSSGLEYGSGRFAGYRGTRDTRPGRRAGVTACTPATFETATPISTAPWTSSSPSSTAGRCGHSCRT